MRAKRTSQVNIFDQFAAHDIGRELQDMSAQLDAHPVLLDFVAEDLGAKVATGRCGLTAESALRCALLKQYRQLSYEELAFHLLDSASFQAFARLPLHWTPSKSALQAGIVAISDATWEAINGQLLSAACVAGVERGELWRLDSTAIDSPIHDASDSSLLLGGVRVAVRMLDAAQALPGATVLNWRNHMRRAKKRKKRAPILGFTCRQDKKQRLYQDLHKVKQDTLGYLEDSVARLNASRVDVVLLLAWQGEVERFAPLITRTRRRVFDGERVPAPKKIVSLFQQHMISGSPGHTVRAQAQPDQRRQRAHLRCRR